MRSVGGVARKPAVDLLGTLRAKHREYVSLEDKILSMVLGNEPAGEIVS